MNSTKFAALHLRKHGLDAEPRTQPSIQALDAAWKAKEACQAKLNWLNTAGDKMERRRWSNRKSSVAKEVYDSVLQLEYSHHLKEQEVAEDALKREQEYLRRQLAVLRAQRERTLTLIEECVVQKEEMKADDSKQWEDIDEETFPAAVDWDAYFA